VHHRFDQKAMQVYDIRAGAGNLNKAISGVSA
jgi:hypothetical protein